MYKFVEYRNKVSITESKWFSKVRTSEILCPTLWTDPVSLDIIVSPIKSIYLKKKLVPDRNLKIDKACHVQRKKRL